MIGYSLEFRLSYGNCLKPFWMAQVLGVKT